VKLVDELGHATKVTSASTDSPKEVGVGGLVGGEDRSIGSDDGDLRYG
jgi:hypothetical protein